MPEFPSQYIVDAADELRANAGARVMGKPIEATSPTQFRRQVATRHKTKPENESRLYKATHEGSFGNLQADMITVEVVGARRTPAGEVEVTYEQYGPFPMFGSKEELRNHPSMQTLRRWQGHPNVIKGMASAFWHKGEEITIAEFEKAARQARGEE